MQVTISLAILVVTSLTVSDVTIADEPRDSPDVRLLKDVGWHLWIYRQEILAGVLEEMEIMNDESTNADDPRLSMLDTAAEPEERVECGVCVVSTPVLCVDYNNAHKSSLVYGTDNYVYMGIDHCMLMYIVYKMWNCCMYFDPY